MVQSCQVIEQVLQTDRFIVHAGQEIPRELRILVGAVQQRLDRRTDRAKRTAKLVHEVRQQLPAMERMLAYFVKRRDARGLFKLDDVGAHWYYDCIATSGVNAYYNAFFYKAACDLAELEEAAGFAAKAAEFARYDLNGDGIITPAECGKADGKK